ncbi:glycosyltransferase family 2 protein [Dictyobacter aurantiacus]|uniref:Glycosyl transferase n=1 Tax=Dictyobacter aurantiacus TaxID=1936993 RepID=A0A401ZNH6_9CHLR|nr:glycosyltransferase family A protein [Dictyobacter aurantiacus]GCE08437.1 glycosyl transferase [Dictyobacter aurantiacus]
MIPKVSVVVPTYKRYAYLERCLRALLSLEFAPGEYEIIIVDDANSQRTRQQVEEWRQRTHQDGYEIVYVPVELAPHGPAAARNAGWQRARSELIAFIDDDCIPELSWLKAGVAAFSDDVAAVSGKIVVPLQHDYTEYEYSVSQLSQSEFVTANCFYRRSVLRQLDGFDTRFRASWCEDSDLYFTLLEHGLHGIKAPDAIVMHPVRPARWGMSLRLQRKGLYDALLCKKHPDLYRKRIQSRPLWNYYCILGVLLLLLAALILGLWPLALICVAAWLYMTARLCIQRLHKTARTPRHVFEMALTSALLPPLAIFWRCCGMLRFRMFFL